MLRSFLIFHGEEANCTFRFISDVKKIQLETKVGAHNKSFRKGQSRTQTYLDDSFLNSSEQGWGGKKKTFRLATLGTNLICYDGKVFQVS